MNCNAAERKGEPAGRREPAGRIEQPIPARKGEEKRVRREGLNIPSQEVEEKKRARKHRERRESQRGEMEEGESQYPREPCGDRPRREGRVEPVPASKGENRKYRPSQAGGRREYPARKIEGRRE